MSAQEQERELVAGDLYVVSNGAIKPVGFTYADVRTVAMDAKSYGALSRSLLAIVEAITRKEASPR